MALEIDTVAGWQQPTLSEVRERVVQYWTGEFGDDSPTDSTTSNGQVIDVIAQIAALGFLGLHTIYLNSFARSAQGNALDRRLDLLGFTRRDDTFASFDVLLAAATGSTLPHNVTIGTLVQNATTEYQAAIAETVTIETSTTTQPWVLVFVTSSADGNYTVTIDGTPYTFAASGNTIEQIRDGVIALIDAGSDAQTLPLATNAFVINLLTPGDTWSVSVGLDGRSAARVRATATEVFVGDFDGSASLTLPVPDAAVEYVINLSQFNALEGDPVDEVVAAIAGATRETDATYLDRYLGAVSQDGANAPRIALALSQLPGVTFVRVYENDTDTDNTGSGGLPPHSIEALVLGGTDQDIADTLAREVAAGIRAYGTDGPLVVDGKSIEWSRPVPLYLWIDLDITTGEDYSSAGDPASVILEAVYQYLSAMSSPGYLRPGRDVYRLSIASAAANAVAGIQTCVVELDTTFTEGGPPTYTAADITVPLRSVAIPAISRMQIAIT